MALIVLALQSGLSLEQAKDQAFDNLHDQTKHLINIILSSYRGFATHTAQLMKEVIKRNQVEQQLNIFAKKLKLTVQHLEKTNEDLKNQYNDTIKIFAHMIDMRPGIKGEQSKFIIEKAMLIARSIGMSAEESKNLMYAALLMKLGKIAFSDALLAKPFNSIALADKEYYLKHAIEGEALLGSLVPLKGASLLIRHQYERYDGSGLPDGLAKQNIPMGSRILSVASDFISYLDGSMTGETMPVNTAITQLIDRKGSYYDPEIVDVFVELIKDDYDEDEVVAVEDPVVKKSWKGSSLRNKEKERNFADAYSIIEIAWPQLKIGMVLESVYFGDKPYLRNCIVDKKIIEDIVLLNERIGLDPIIKIRLDKKYQQ
jgi:response regulator RpfG family c-di-GMP phosphodiesterase